MMATAASRLAPQAGAATRRTQHASFTRAAPLQRGRYVCASSSSSENGTSAPNNQMKINPPSEGWAQEIMEEVLDTKELGQRGEAWFAAQLLGFVLVLFPPEPLRSLLDGLGGTLGLLGGIALLSGGLLSLGDSLTPLPKPRDSSELVTDGAYELCRHPMYGGLILAGAGLALLTGDELRLLLVLGLAWVLDGKASYEEELLVERYGDKYISYKGKAKKLIPFLY